MNGWVLLVAVAAQLIVAGVCSEASTVGSQWQQLQWQCLDESNAAMRAEAVSTRHCTMRAADLSGDLVAQWNSDTGVCCVFHYQQVCRLASAAASAVCHIFGRIGATGWPLNSKFVGVWVFSDDERRTENRVCNSNDLGKNRFHASNISWSAEGATFNGVDSYMLMNDTDDMSFSDGFTWLLRLKRQPRVQALLEAFGCISSPQIYGHLWEHEVATKLYFNSLSVGFPPYFHLESVAGTLPNDANTWINVGVIGSPSDNSRWLYYGSGFLTESQVTGSTFSGSSATPICLLLGRRWTDPRVLHGTVAAVGIANATMTEAEIRHFFSQLP